MQDDTPDPLTPSISSEMPKPVEMQKPAIPPPDLSRAAPAPPSPLDSLPKSSSPPPMPSGNVGARVHLHGAADAPVVTGEVPINSRILAAVLDLLVAGGLAIAVSFILPWFGSRIAWLVSAAYLLTRDSLPFLDGQSVGKKAMKLKVVTLDGSSLAGNWEVGAIRNAILMVPFVGILIELIVLLTREDKPERGRRLGDEWAKTKVIVVPNSMPVDEAGPPLL
jgi:uncharacterized RDD family membrane protein YckC